MRPKYAFWNRRNSCSKDAYLLALQRSFKDAGLAPSSVSFVETHGSGYPAEDRMEAEALNSFFTQNPEPCAVGSLKPNLGHAGAASGLASLIKTSLCLYQEIIPPLKNFVKPAHQIRSGSALHIPAFPQYWMRNSKDGPRRACTSAMTPDGNCMHVILEGFEYESVELIPEKVARERIKPLGPLDLDKFYANTSAAVSSTAASKEKSVHLIRRIAGGQAPSPALPEQGSEVKDQYPVSSIQYPVSRNQYPAFPIRN